MSSCWLCADLGVRAVGRDELVAVGDEISNVRGAVLRHAGLLLRPALHGGVAHHDLQAARMHVDTG